MEKGRQKIQEIELASSEHEQRKVGTELSAEQHGMRKRGFTGVLHCPKDQPLQRWP